MNLQKMSLNSKTGWLVVQLWSVMLVENHAFGIVHYWANFRHDWLFGCLIVKCRFNLQNVRMEHMIQLSYEAIVLLACWPSLRLPDASIFWLGTHAIIHTSGLSILLSIRDKSIRHSIIAAGAIQPAHQLQISLEHHLPLKQHKESRIEGTEKDTNTQ